MCPRDLEAYPEVQTRPEPVDEDGQQCLRIADIIEQRGHCKGHLMDSYGRVCLYGAFAVDKGWNGDWNAIGSCVSEEARAELAFAHRLGFSTTDELVQWNNDPKTTANDVDTRLRSAAHGGRG